LLSYHQFQQALNAEYAKDAEKYEFESLTLEMAALPGTSSFFNLTIHALRTSASSAFSAIRVGLFET